MEQPLHWLIIESDWVGQWCCLVTQDKVYRSKDPFNRNHLIVGRAWGRWVADSLTVGFLLYNGFRIAFIFLETRETSVKKKVNGVKYLHWNPHFCDEYTQFNANKTITKKPFSFPPQQSYCVFLLVAISWAAEEKNHFNRVCGEVLPCVRSNLW